MNQQFKNLIVGLIKENLIIKIILIVLIFIAILIQYFIIQIKKQIGAIESGKLNTTVKTLKKISDSLDIQVKDIFSF